MSSKIRHFILPLFPYTHPKATTSTVVALVNGKRGMPPRLMAYEGMIGLFGGLAQEGETSEQALCREVWDDGPDSELSALPKDGVWRWDYLYTDPENRFTITPYILTAPWTQDLYRTLAASCGEGILDFIRLDDTAWKLDRWVYQEMPDTVAHLMAFAGARTLLR